LVKDEGGVCPENRRKKKRRECFGPKCKKKRTNRRERGELGGARLEKKKKKSCRTEAKTKPGGKNKKPLREEAKSASTGGSGRQLTRVVETTREKPAREGVEGKNSECKKTKLRGVHWGAKYKKKGGKIYLQGRRRVGDTF